MLHIFDLDNTLVHTTRNVFDGRFTVFHIHVDNQQHYVHVRPHVLDFIQSLCHHRIPWGVWTAAKKEYMTKVVQGLLRLANVHNCPHLAETLKVCLHREHTTRIANNIYLKDLTLFTPEEVILYDDSTLHRERNTYGKVVLVPKFDITRRKARFDCYFLTLCCIERQLANFHLAGVR